MKHLFTFKPAQIKINNYEFVYARKKESLYMREAGTRDGQELKRVTLASCFIGLNEVNTASPPLS